jgi:hypothetical protein
VFSAGWSLANYLRYNFSTPQFADEYGLNSEDTSKSFYTSGYVSPTQQSNLATSSAFQYTMTINDLAAVYAAATVVPIDLTPYLVQRQDGSSPRVSFQASTGIKLLNSQSLSLNLSSAVSWPPVPLFVQGGKLQGVFVNFRINRNTFTVIKYANLIITGCIGGEIFELNSAFFLFLFFRLQANPNR